MTDLDMLRCYVDASGIRMNYLALQMGISTGSLRKKLNGESEFKVSEAAKLANLLQMTPEQRDRCFFAPFSTIGLCRGGTR